MKLYRLRYSPYARKVQLLLDWLGLTYEAIEVPYGDRTELATLTGGYVYVPVLVVENGHALVESKAIADHLVGRSGAEWLVPTGAEAVVWAYHDWVDGPLEDVLFRIGSPAVRDSWQSPWERALYVLVKERKFGAGCVDQWQRDRAALIQRARQLLEPTLRTLSQRPFLLGEVPTLADAALYGNCAMLEVSESLLADVSPKLVEYAARCQSYRRLHA